MSLSKEEVREAFRAAVMQDLLPAEEHQFSEGFCRRMEAMIRRERRGAWQTLSRRRRRILVLAAMLSLAALLGSCAPMREVTKEILHFIRPGYVDYVVETTERDSVETMYVLDPVPEGYVMVSQELQTPYMALTYYENGEGARIVLQQFTGTATGAMDNRQGDFRELEVDGGKVLAYFSDNMTSAHWFCDGYGMMLTHFDVPPDESGLLALIASVSPPESES
jgi:hypothetical protein